MRRLLALIVFAYPLVVDAGPPGADGICADLKDGTPGLFGLCVAYCEAQDANGGRPESSQSALSLLTAYDRRRGPDDPEMPCLADASPPAEPPPQASCFCWTADDLETALPSPDCAVVNNTYSAAQDTGAVPSVAVVYEDPVSSGHFCQFEDGLSSQPLPSKYKFFLPSEEVKGCVALWQYHANRTGCLVQ